MAKIKLLHVPFKSTGDAMASLLTGNTPVIVGSLPPLVPLFQNGKLRPLAVTTEKRWHSVPNLPTIGETLPGYEVKNWFGMLAPAKTPPEILDRLNAAVNKAVQDPEMKKQIDSQGMVGTGGTAAAFGDSSLRVSLAGPRRPQDRLDAAQVPAALRDAIGVSGAADARASEAVPVDAVAIAAITSCTNTTDTGLLVTAGLLAQKARRFGLKPPAWVKTSLAPGSPAAASRLTRAGVLPDLEAVGFAIAGYGCTTCIGNSGPLLPVVSEAIARGEAKPVAVLSGNRNFPGRVHANIDSALLASPPIVVAYALAGRALIDITRDPLGADESGRPVYLSDVWPSRAEVEAAVAAATDASDVARAANEAESSGPWSALDAPASARFPWDPASTYLRRPPFVAFVPSQAQGATTLAAHPLLVLGDDITTDHISPAGAIPAQSDAGVWLVERGDKPADLNVYAARRGNFEVMVRGLFTNRTVVNHLCPGAAPGETVFAPTGEIMPVWRAATRYAEQDIPVVIVAGERYGTGSSRDWAAKGAQMLGAKAVLAASFERIHRSNLIGMGVLPLRLPEGWVASTLRIAPGDTIEIDFDPAALAPRSTVHVRLRRHATGEVVAGESVALLDTAKDVELIRAGGIIPMILERALHR